MSDGHHDRTPEDRAIEQAWNQVMATGSEPRLLRGGDDADPALMREYTELLGLLPYQLEAEEPPAQIKEQLLARVAGSRAREQSQPPPATPFARPAPAASSSWSFAQAAALAAGLVGISFLSTLVWQQHRQIAQLTDQVTSSAEIRQEMRTLRSRLDMVTTVARKAYPMRTVSHGPAGSPGSATPPLPGSGQPGRPDQPEGIVYVCGMHQQWYLSLRGLEPPEEDGRYRLWFMTEDGKIDGGVLDVRSDTSSEMEAMTMPDGTQGFLVTLETPDEPEGMEVLLGESAINL